MKLTFEQIKSITVGSVNTVKTEDGIRFFKCTEKQLEAWRQKSATVFRCATGTTGVRLDFHTNSQKLAFRVLSGKKYEVQINSLPVAVFNPEPGDIIQLELSDTIGRRLDEYRVTVIFPSHDDGGAIEYLDLDDGAFVRPHKFDRRFLFIGDSITQGWESSLDSYSYAYRVSSFFNAESVIQGIGGAFYYKDSFDVIDFDPDTVFVAYGTNDFSHYKTYDEFRRACEDHLSLIANAYAGKKIFVISPIWRDKRDGKPMGSFDGCIEIIKQTAEKLKLIHIDGLNLVPPLTSLFADGYLHPNDNGFSLYAENLIKEIIEQI